MYALFLVLENNAYLCSDIFENMRVLLKNIVARIVCLAIVMVVGMPLQADETAEVAYNTYNKRMAIALNRYRSTANIDYAYNMGMLGALIADKSAGEYYNRKKGQRYMLDAAEICMKIDPYSEQSALVLDAAIAYFNANLMIKQSLQLADGLCSWLLHNADSLNGVKRSAKAAEKFRLRLYHVLKTYSEAVLTSAQQGNFYDLILLKKQNPCLADNYVSTDSVLIDKTDRWQQVEAMLSGDQGVVEMVVFTDADTLCIAASCLATQWKAPRKVQIHLSDTLIRAARLSKMTICRMQHYYQAVWVPIFGQLSPKQLFFVPDGVLNSLLLERAMIGSGKYVCDVCELHRITTSLKMGKYNSLRTKSLFSKVTLMGYVDYGDGLSWQRLLGSAHEINDIYNIIINAGYRQVEAWRGGDCSEQRFRNMQAEPITLLHIATHGYVVTRDSLTLSTGLILANANDAWPEWSSSEAPSTDNDGILTSDELSELHFPLLRLAVLSACRTGLAEATDYNPMLLNALRSAGAQNVMLSHWAVNDNATRMLMVEFYNNLISKNLNMAQALQQAQKKVRSSTFEFSNGKSSPNNGADPYFWAPFILYEF